MEIAQEALDYIAIRRLQSAYADAVSRRAWGELAALFLSDAVVELELPGSASLRFEGGVEIAAFIERQISAMEFFQFVVLNTVIELAPNADADRATARMWMSELRQSSGQFSQIWGLYRDTYRRTPEGWRFAGRRYQSLARTTPDLVTFPVPPN